MSKPFLAPGCFGSVISMQVASDGCSSCSYRETCLAETIRVESDVLALIERKMKARSENGDTIERAISRVKHYFRNRKRTNEPKVHTGNVRSDKLLELFRDERIDLSKIVAGVNPFNPTKFPLFHHATAFLIEGVPFKPKDVAEHIYETGLFTLSKSSLSSEVARYLTALTTCGVLKRDKHILCLN